MTSNDYDCTFKILVLGDSGVGKTCLIYRYTEGLFSDTYVSTIGIKCKPEQLLDYIRKAGKEEELYMTKMLEMEDLKVRMQIWDTAGQERFRTLTSAYYRGAMGVLLVYDVTTEDSFSHVASWLRNIEDNASADVCKVLVGNKADKEDERKVSTERGRMVAQNNSLQFFETSAKTGQGVAEAFKSLADLIKELKDRKDKMPEDIVNSFDRSSSKVSHEQSRCC